MKVFKTDLLSLSKQFTLRSDFKYRNIWDNDDGNIFCVESFDELNTILEEMKVKKYKKGELDKEYTLINISDQKPRYIDLINLETISEINSDKTELSGCDIIISKLGLPKGYIYLNNGTINLIGSTELIPYKVINEKYDKKFLKYLFTLKAPLKKLASLESGKTPSHKRVNPYDLLKIKIPKVAKSKQLKVVKRIEELECEIRELENKKISELSVINEVFKEMYNLPNDIEEQFGKAMSAPTQKFNDREKKIYKVSFSELSQNENLRLSTRFHNEITKFIESQLKRTETIKLKNILLEKIVRGVQPKVDENGEVVVIKTGQLKNSNIDLNEADYVNFDFYNTKSRACISKGDILIASTGKGSIGKIDMMNLECDAMVDGHISIVRINEEKYNAKFLLYFLRSILGVFQIERDYTGATNQIELNRNEIENFDIPNIDLKQQEEIVKKIEEKIKYQNNVEVFISSKREKIDNLILKTIY